MNPAEPRILSGMTIDELADAYTEAVQRQDADLVDLAQWLPDFRSVVRPIVAGDVVVIMADTGNAKTCTLQHIAAAIHPEPCMFFELELTGNLLFERFAAMSNGLNSFEVEQKFRKYGNMAGNVNLLGLSHIWTCTESRMGLADVEATVRAALDGKIKNMIGRPKAIFLDYMGLFSAQEGSSRYERITNIADNLKPMAKSLGVALFISTQIKRRDDKAGIEVGLHDAKDSGNIEQVASLLLGQWLEGKQLKIKVCKNTKGQAGHVITANWDGTKMSITPIKPAIDPTDLPGEEYNSNQTF